MTIVGTAAYMSPEQARGQKVDRRTDIWAFGCVLFEMLSGTQAFGGATISDSIAAILDRDPDWTKLPPAAPPAVRRLLQRCLEKDPQRRLRDIGEVPFLLAPEIAAMPRRPVVTLGATLDRRRRPDRGVCSCSHETRQSRLPPRDPFR